MFRLVLEEDAALFPHNRWPLIPFCIAIGAYKKITILSCGWVGVGSSTYQAKGHASVGRRKTVTVEADADRHHTCSGVGRKDPAMSLLKM